MTSEPKYNMLGTLAFKDPALLQRALTHRSYLNEHPGEALESNERLEFLGDAVISLISAQYLYNRFPEMQEGPLTRLRAALVRRDGLAGFAKQLGLPERLLLSRGEEESGGRSRPALLCDAFEALVGALYLDQGFAAAKAFVEPLLAGAVAALLAEERYKDARSELQELTQARFQVTPQYRTVAESGPDHAKEFVVEVTVAGRPCGRGQGHSKQIAALRAAADALARFESAESLDDVPALSPAPNTLDEQSPK
jgi:ribonuclease-3